MCLMLYLATASEQPLLQSADLGIEEVEARRCAVRSSVTLPFVRLVTAHGTCSCGFPSFIGDEPVVYDDWLASVLAKSDDREADLRSVRALLALIREHVLAGHEVELYPVADGAEDQLPKGTVTMSLQHLEPERFVVTEQFLHRVVA